MPQKYLKPKYAINPRNIHQDFTEIYFWVNIKTHQDLVSLFNYKNKKQSKILSDWGLADRLQEQGIR